MQEPFILLIILTNVDSDKSRDGGNTAWITTLHYTTPLIIQYRLTDDRSTHKTNINDNIGPNHSLFLMSFCFCLLSPLPSAAG